MYFSKKALTTVILSGLLYSGCSTPDTSSSSTNPNLLNPNPSQSSQSTPSYGAELIGFKTGDLVQDPNQVGSSNQTPSATSQNSAEPESSMQAAPSRDDGEYNEGDLGEYPGAEPEVNYSRYLEPDFFDNALQNHQASWSMLFEGQLDGYYYTSLQESRLVFEESNIDLTAFVQINANQDQLHMSATHHLGTSSTFDGPIQYSEQIEVHATLNQNILESSAVDALEEISGGAHTVLVQKTYQSNGALRAQCVVAESQSTSETATGMSGETWFTEQESEFEDSPFVSLASLSPLTQLNTETEDDSDSSNPNYLPSSEQSQVLLEQREIPLAGEETCQCFDSSGMTEISCADFDRSRDPNLPVEKPFLDTANDALSTFSLDVDTASYTLVRQALNAGHKPAPKTIRIEEMVNYFKYNYTLPQDDPFTVYTEVSDCPWNPNHKLAMIGVRGQEINVEDHPPANLVYLLDVSGSMREELWLIKPAFHLLTRQLRPEDTLSIVVYAGRDAVVLDGARGDETDRIMAAIDELESGGGTNGAMGIERAYQIAQENFVMNGNNRVILATDGDFNMGISDDEELVEFIEEKADEGVFLTIYGFSQYSDSYQDEKMEALSNHGNGTYFFIDGAAEAQ
jgi:hypothetical protein